MFTETHCTTIFKDVTEGINELIIAQRLTSHAVSVLIRYYDLLHLEMDERIV